MRIVYTFHGIVVCVLLCFAPLLWAQEEATGDVFSPFVSRLRAQVESNTIILSWRDTSDVDGTYLVYRHTQEIGPANFQQAELIAEVDSGTEYYVDHPYLSIPFFYAVLAEDTDGELYELFIPFRNKTVNGVSVQSVISEEERVAEISDISTKIRNESIVLGFSNDKLDRRLIVYRNTAPISSIDDILKANLLTTIPGTAKEFVDYPVPGVPYYYGVFDAEQVKTGSFTFNTDQNVTTVPVEIPLTETTIGLNFSKSTTSRSRPLPYLLLSSSVISGEALSSPITITTPEPNVMALPTVKALAGILNTIEPPPEPTPQPVILAYDTIPHTGGEEYTLGTILNREFRRREWDATERLLTNFLSVKRSRPTENRTRFYLGQVYFFQEKYREAFLEFLLAAETTYVESQEWLDIVLQKLRL